MKKNVQYITTAAMIAAVYTVLVMVLAPISFGAVQFRLAESLTTLPYFTTAAIPGLSIGCLLSNLLAGADILDVVFGTLATLIGAVGTYFFRRCRFLAWLPPFLSNTLIVPLILTYAYASSEAYPYLCLTVGIGELVTCGILGTLLLLLIDRRHILNKES